MLHVTAEGVSDAVLAAIAAVPGVVKAVATPMGVDVTLPAGSDVSAEVSRALVLAGARLKELKAEERSLEDLFLALTKGGRV
jgi:ABC-2 type transport system ATP-binding protein